VGSLLSSVCRSCSKLMNTVFDAMRHFLIQKTFKTSKVKPFILATAVASSTGSGPSKLWASYRAAFISSSVNHLHSSVCINRFHEITHINTMWQIFNSASLSDNIISVHFRFWQTHMLWRYLSIITMLKQCKILTTLAF